MTDWVPLARSVEGGGSQGNHRARLASPSLHWNPGFHTCLHQRECHLLPQSRRSTSPSTHRCHARETTLQARTRRLIIRIERLRSRMNDGRARRGSPRTGHVRDSPRRCLGRVVSPGAAAPAAGDEAGFDCCRRKSPCARRRGRAQVQRERPHCSDKSNTGVRERKNGSVVAPILIASWPLAPDPWTVALGRVYAG